MKYSIRTKLIILILAALIMLAMIIGGTSLYFSGRLSDAYAHQYVSLLCENKTSDMNSIFSSIEQAVDYMSINAMEELSNPLNLTDEIYYENYMDKMTGIISNVSKHTDGAISVYYRFNPELCGSKAGIFMTRDRLDRDMRMVETTDLYAYDESDIEHVGWYYQPLDAMKPVWMLPYYNKNIGVYMISYVIPLFKNDMTVGVIGMDIDFDYITEQVEAIKLYKSGYAYITDQNGDVVSHPDLEYGEPVSVPDGWWYSQGSLDNGMLLNITAPVSEINASRNTLVMNIVGGSVIVIIVFIFITIAVTRKMIAPLQKLNRIANEISAGNYEVDFNFERPNDEVGQLTKSFQNTVETLKEYMTYINGLAYKDALTGVRNRTAYDFELEQLKEKLKKEEDMPIAFAVFDVNNLKYVNDNFGHEKGDELIKGACRLICNTLNHSAVFRIGGDEFVAIIKENNEERISMIFNAFLDEMKKSWDEAELSDRISVAYGFSVYDSAKDGNSFEDVFKRADDMMYEKKKVMKAALEG